MNPFHLDFYTSSTQAKDRAWLQMAKIFQNDAVAAGRISTSKMNAHECSPRSRSNQVGSVEEGLLLFLHRKGPNRQTPPHTRSKQSETICGKRICVQKDSLHDPLVISFRPVHLASISIQSIQFQLILLSLVWLTLICKRKHSTKLATKMVSSTRGTCLNEAAAKADCCVLRSNDSLVCF